MMNNPIGGLQEICAANQWNFPIYTLEHEEGPPHNRLFTISCALKSYKEFGTAASKKLAKRYAAIKMNYILEQRRENPYGEILNIRPNSMPENGVCSQRFAYPPYFDYDKRLKSFEDWSSTHGPTPNKMADVGFFYTGEEDKTICFCCGIGLYNWEDNDDPMIEHLRHNNNCSFILNCIKT